MCIIGQQIKKPTHKLGIKLASTAKNNSEKSNGRSSRGKLLVATAELMTESGSLDVSLSQLAERAGVNSALVKYYFKSKSGMMFELAKQTLADPIEQLLQLVESDLSADEKMKLHIRGMINTYFYHPYVNRLLHHLFTVEGGKFFEKINQDLVSPIADCQASILKQGKEDGIFRDVDPILFYFHLNGASDQIFHNHTTLKATFGIDNFTEDMKNDFIDHLTETLLGGIRK